MKKLLIIPLAFISAGIFAQSQLNVVETNSSTTSFPLEGIRSITFDADNIFITDTNSVENVFTYNGTQRLTFEEIVTSIDELVDANDNLSVYPNPVIDNQFTARLEFEKNSTVNLVLRNLSGQVMTVSNRNVREGQNNLNVSVDNLATGTYILTVQSENQTFIEKIIKY